MLKLNIRNEPRWLDCGYGVRLHLKPATSSLMAEARRDPAVRGLLPEMAGDDEMPELDPGTNEALGVALAQAVARRCVIGWEGVGDEEGVAIKAPTPEGVDALIEVPGIFEVFLTWFVAPALVLVV